MTAFALIRRAARRPRTAAPTRSGAPASTVEIDTFGALRGIALFALVAVAAVMGMVLVALHVNPFSAWPAGPEGATAKPAALAPAPVAIPVMGPDRRIGSSRPADRPRTRAADRRRAGRRTEARRRPARPQPAARRRAGRAPSASPAPRATPSPPVAAAPVGPPDEQPAERGGRDEDGPAGDLLERLPDVVGNRPALKPTAGSADVEEPEEPAVAAAAPGAEHAGPAGEHR